VQDYLGPSDVDVLLSRDLRQKAPDLDETFFSIVDRQASRRIAVGARRGSTQTGRFCGIALHYSFNHFNDLHESDWEMIQQAESQPDHRPELGYVLSGWPPVILCPLGV
jgi:hypothetical protein